MSFKNTLKQLNLSQIIGSLVHDTSKLPYYLLKINPTAVPLYASKCGLTISRKTSQEIFNFNAPFYTVWSTYHLNSVSHFPANMISNKIILKNLYKSEQIIKKALNMGIRHMFIDSIEQFQKIQRIKNSSIQFSALPIHYTWFISEQTSDHPQIPQQIYQIKNYIKGLYFDHRKTELNLKQMNMIIKKMIDKGVSLETVINSGMEEQFNLLEKWKSQTNLPVSKLLQIRNHSDLENYLLLSKCHDRKKGIIISEEIRELIKGINTRDTTIINSNKGDWLISKISQFPLNHQCTIDLQIQQAEQERYAHAV